MPFATIQSASAPRLRKATLHKSAPVPTHLRKEKAAARAEKQAAIDEAIGEWYSYTLAKADELAERFHKKPQYFMDFFFQGGAHMVTHQEKINPYNAFMSLKAQEINAGVRHFV